MGVYYTNYPSMYLLEQFQRDMNAIHHYPITDTYYRSGVGCTTVFGVSLSTARSRLLVDSQSSWDCVAIMRLTNHSDAAFPPTRLLAADTGHPVSTIYKALLSMDTK